MIKQFTLKQLFSVADGRLSTKMDDVYEIMNHVCDDTLMTHHLPVAGRYIAAKNPEWLRKVRDDLDILNITEEKPFAEAMEIVDKNNATYDVPQLKDEHDTSDFGDYMCDNSLLKGKDVIAVTV